MPHDPYLQYVALIFIGLGLFFVSVANHALRQVSFRRRAAATVLTAGAVLAACVAFDGNTQLLPPVVIALAVILIPALLLSTPRGGRMLQTIGEKVRRPQSPWWGCALLGIAIIVGSSLQFEDRDRERLDEALVELDTIASLDRELGRTLFRGSNVQLFTDQGTRVECLEPINPRPADEALRIENAFYRERWKQGSMLKRAPADDHTNCYGWIFTGGKYWLHEKNCELILRENGYIEVAKPRVGDLVVYRQDHLIVHMGLLRSTDKNVPSLVEGKFGYLGVFLHTVDQSPYGSHFSFLRSPRAGHLLSGLSQSGDPAPPEETE